MDKTKELLDLEKQLRAILGEVPKEEIESVAKEAYEAVMNDELPLEDCLMPALQERGYRLFALDYYWTLSNHVVLYAKDEKEAYKRCVERAENTELTGGDYMEDSFRVDDEEDFVWKNSL